MRSSQCSISADTPIRCRHIIRYGIANLVRLISVPVAILIVLRGGTIQQILMIGVGSEVLSLGISLFLLRNRLALPVPGRTGLPYALMLVLLVTLLSRMETATWDPMLDCAAILFFGQLYT